MYNFIFWNNIITMSSDFPNYGKVLAKNIHLDESGIKFFKNDDDSKSVTLKVTPSEAGNVDIQLPTSSGTLMTTGDSVSLGVGDIDNANLFAANVVDNSALASDAVQDANVAAGANISYSKLNLNNAIQSTDLAGSIAYAKLDLNNAVQSTDLAGSIAYAKLDLNNAVTNADLAGNVATAKLADAPASAGTVEASKIVQADTNKDVSGARHVTAEGTVQAGNGEAFRLGGDSDGSWRMQVSGGDLVFQKKETGTWTTKHTVTAS